MKKFYAFLAVAMMAATASAQTLYFKGAGEGLSWDVAVDLPVQLVDGKYTVTINNLTEFKVSTVACTTWDDFNAEAFYAPGLDQEANLGQAMPTEKNSGPNNATPWKGDYTIVIPADLSTITITTTTPKPVGFTKAYIRGTVNDWLNTPTEDLLATWELKTNDGINYWIDCVGASKLVAGTSFKIADLDWASINNTLGDIMIPFEEPIEWMYGGSNNDTVVEEDYEGTIHLDLSNGPRQPAMVTVFPGLNPENPFAGVEGIVVDENAPAEYFNLQGVRVAQPEAGLYIVRRAGKVSKVLVK